MNSYKDDPSSNIWQAKYLKYKEKYLNLKKSGANESSKTTIKRAIRKYFNGAKSNTQLIEYIKTMDLNKDKTHFTLSICCDEINHEIGDIPDLCRNLFGDVFQIGGLGGIPFPGITGLNATLHHVPTDGTLFILYGPHVGISLDGTIGNYNRFGIEKPGHACGAAIGAYHKINQTNNQVSDNPYDHQFNYIVEELKNKKDEINKEKDENLKNVRIVESMFDIIYKWIEEFKKTFKNQNEVKKLILLGGIVINVSRQTETINNLEDHFLIKNVETVEI